MSHPTPHTHSIRLALLVAALMLLLVPALDVATASAKGRSTTSAKATKKAKAAKASSKITAKAAVQTNKSSRKAKAKAKIAAKASAKVCVIKGKTPAARAASRKKCRAKAPVAPSTTTPAATTPAPAATPAATPATAPSPSAQATSPAAVVTPDADASLSTADSASKKPQPTAPTAPAAPTAPTATTPADAGLATPPAALADSLAAMPATLRAATLQAAATPAAKPLQIGLVANTQAWGPGTANYQAKATATGIRNLREEFEWDTFEPARGAYDWSRYDNVVRQAALRNVRILPLVMDTPAWAGPGRRALPVDTAAYGKAVAAVAARYGSGGTFWAANPTVTALPIESIEIWNEPYIPSFAGGKPDPAGYARLVRAATTAGRAANPNVKFLLEADTTSYNATWTAQSEWINAMYAADPKLNEVFDGVAVHPYGELDGLDPQQIYSRWQFRRMEQIRATFVARGAADKPFHITEVGMPTCPAGRAYDCVSENDQALHIVRLVVALKTTYASYVRSVYLYSYQDYGTGISTDKEQWFGMVRRDGNPKIAWSALQFLLYYS